jgi:hypothetical protein
MREPKPWYQTLAWESLKIVTILSASALGYACYPPVGGVIAGASVIGILSATEQYATTGKIDLMKVGLDVTVGAVLGIVGKILVDKLVARRFRHSVPSV